MVRGLGLRVRSAFAERLAERHYPSPSAASYCAE
jgi:hypothetical protein